MTDPSLALALKFGAFKTKLEVKYVTGESLSPLTLLAAVPVFCFSAQFRSTKSFLIELILSPEDSLAHSLPFRHQKR